MRKTDGIFSRAALASALLLAALVMPGDAQEQKRRNIFGMHNLKDGGPDLQEGLEWTRHLVGSGFVFDWVTDIPTWIDAAFRLDLVPCIRVQEGRGGAVPSAGYAGEVASVIMRYKIAHPEFADRLVYLQLWNEPNDPRDFVHPFVYADYLVAAHHAVHEAEANAAAEHPELPLAGTLKTMTPGQNGPSWWDQAFTHNPDAKLAFDVWATHPYPEAAPPHYNHHDGDVFVETTKTIDSYLMDLDVVARPHGSPPRSRRGFPVMITETAYGNKLGISYEGWPKTNRAMAAAYDADAFSQRWYRWPEILAVHPYLLANIGWESFAWVPASSCNASPKPGCAEAPRCSEECNGDGVREPKAPFPQYDAVRDLRLALEGQGMAPARRTPFRGQTGTIRGRTVRADTGAAVPYVTVRSDGYAIGHVSLFDGGYEVQDFPVGAYTLTAEKNGFRSATRQVTVAAGQSTSADFSLVPTGRVSRGIYFVDSPPLPGCPGCQLFDRTLGQTFTVPSDVGFIKYAAVKPYIDGVTLVFSVRDGGPGGVQLGPSLTVTLEPGDGAIMIGGEWPDGQEPAVQPGGTYFLQVERADGLGIYCYASNANPYAGGNAWVGGRAQSGVDFVAVLRGLTRGVETPAPSAGSITGTVRDTSDRPLPGADVATAAGGYRTTTDATGAYALSGLAPGAYAVAASKAGYSGQTEQGVSVAAGATTSVHFRLAPLSAAPPKIVNPGFEDDGGFFGVARGWTNFGSNKWEAVWDKDRVFTQGVSEISTTTGVGVYQTIDVTPGVVYRVSVFTKATADGHGGAIGVDPAGGTNAASATWSAVSTSPSWSAVTTSFPAASTRATIFLKGQRTSSLFGWVQFDGVTIEAIGGSANQPPTVTLAVDRTTASAPASFVLTAAAADPDGSISRVEFLQGATVLASDTASPYTFTWSGVPAGGYSLAARAYDDAGASTASTPIAVTVTGSTPGPGPGPGPLKSKLSVHAGWGPSTEAFVRDAKPRVVKLFDEVKNAARIKQLSPETIVVGRLFPGSVPDGVMSNGDPADRARDWWNVVKATVIAYPEVDYWEGLNEPVVTSAVAMSWYAQFEIARVDILAANGRKACIASFATGNPDLALWPQFIPAIDHARTRGGIMGLHEYGTPMRQLWDAQAREGWLTGRYRKVYRQHLAGREIPLVITEAGIDEGTLAANGPGQPRPRPVDAQLYHGWQQALGTPPFPGFPPPGDLAARKPWYLDQLAWYDDILKEDAYVLGATIYALEIPGWGSFDVRPLVPELGAYVARVGP
jgi:hypothetical protein